MIGDVEAVLREALTNIAKHAQATQAWVSIGVNRGRLEVTVADNGVGLDPEATRSGLSNLQVRAEQHGGQLTVGSRSSKGGLRLQWSIPLKV